VTGLEVIKLAVTSNRYKYFTYTVNNGK